MPDRTAEAIRSACLEAARAAYDDAGIAGICEEGRWELALDAIRSLDLEVVIEQAEADAGLADADSNRTERPVR